MAEILVLQPRTPLAERQQHDPIDLAVKDVERAGADFLGAILEAQTVTACLLLHDRIERLILALQAISSAALERADKVNP